MIGIRGREKKWWQQCDGWNASCLPPLAVPRAADGDSIKLIFARVTEKENTPEEDPEEDIRRSQRKRWQTFSSLWQEC